MPFTKKINYLKAWAPPLAWMATIFLLSTRSSISVSDEYSINFLFFKSLHVIEYAVLFALLVRANYLSGVRGLRVYGFSFLLTILYAVSDEIHQIYVPTREGKLRDVIIDGLGATLAWIFLVHIAPRLPRPLRRWLADWHKI